MIIMTGANSAWANKDKKRLRKSFSFREVIEETVRKAEECGYTPVVYDLGSLGFGKRFHVEDESFATKGYYDVEVKKGYKSKSLFKPEMVKTCMEEYNDFIVYLDADAQLCDNIDEVAGDDYDVGVTLRHPVEYEGATGVWHWEHFDIIKYVNAGVIFFNSTPATKRFLDLWQKRTEEVGNDQKALNQLTCPDYRPEAYSVLDIGGTRIKYFPGIKYNYYYFNEGLMPDIKIMHFKGPVRSFFPFDWKKRLFCRVVVPINNNLRHIARKFFMR